MRTFENDHAFVELFAKGNAVHQRWGRKGTPGQTRVDTHATPLEAARAFDQQAKHLATRYRPGVEEESLREAIRTAPQFDELAISIYADWLTQKGDPLGEIIAADLSKSPAKEALLEAHRVHLEPRFEPPAGYVWRTGFIVCALINVWHPSALERLFKHPSSLIIDSLVIMNAEQDLDQKEWRDVLTRGKPSTLTEIEVANRPGLSRLVKRQLIPGLKASPQT